jgi:hypothetical protein
VRARIARKKAAQPRPLKVVKESNGPSFNRTVARIGKQIDVSTTLMFDE